MKMRVILALCMALLLASCLGRGVEPDGPQKPVMYLETAALEMGHNYHLLYQLASSYVGALENNGTITTYEAGTTAGIAISYKRIYDDLKRALLQARADSQRGIYDPSVQAKIQTLMGQLKGLADLLVQTLPETKREVTDANDH